MLTVPLLDIAANARVMCPPALTWCLLQLLLCHWLQERGRGHHDPLHAQSLQGHGHGCDRQCVLAAAKYMDDTTVASTR